MARSTERAHIRGTLLPLLVLGGRKVEPTLVRKGLGASRR